MIAKRRVIKGTGVSAGIAIGRSRIVLPGLLKVAETPITRTQIKGEQAALEQAVRETIVELGSLRDSAGKRMGGSMAKIFDAQLLIASDTEFLDRVRSMIADTRRNAGFCYNALIQETTLSLRKASDQYMRQMASEIEAVSHRVLSHLSGYKERSTMRFREDSILVGRAFSPGEVLSYRNRKAVGFVAGSGTANSHMALIARSLLTPMLIVDAHWTEIPSDSPLVIDGNEGHLIVNPSLDDLANYQKLKKRQGPAMLSRIKRLTEVPPTTADGQPVHVAANLELPGPVDDILSAQKIPIGLYRTEFLYLNSESFPDVDTQAQHYDRIAASFAQSHVVLRTFDLGSDKVKPDNGFVVEENPALGWRGIRSMLEMPETFKTQIRAMLLASTRKNVRILLPMISDLGELKKARKLIAQVMFDMRREGLAFDDKIKVGVMIEVPSAALMADEIARVADFLSIGTNDLTQYTMSADRNNPRVANLYSSLHPSVLRLIQMTLTAGRKHEIPVCICGEIAGDPLAIPLLIGMGINHLSMNPTKIFDSCRLIKRIDAHLVKHLVKSVMSSSSAGSVRRKLQNYRQALNNK